MSYIITDMNYYDKKSVKLIDLGEKNYEIYNMDGDRIAQATADEIPTSWAGAIRFLKAESAAQSVELEDGTMVAEA